MKICQGIFNEFFVCQICTGRIALWLWLHSQDAGESHEGNANQRCKLGQVEKAHGKNQLRCQRLSQPLFFFKIQPFQRFRNEFGSKMGDLRSNLLQPWNLKVRSLYTCTLGSLRCMFLLHNLLFLQIASCANSQSDSRGLKLSTIHIWSYLHIQVHRHVVCACRESSSPSVP